MELKDWIHEEFLEKIPQGFGENKPFAHLVLSDFFKHSHDMLHALVEEEFIQKEADLFKFKQTNDLITSKNKFLEGLRSFLCSKEFVQYMQEVTGESLKVGSIDLHGSAYEDTDFLLCHDDQLDSRKIAFLIYLTDMEEGDGGSLNLFNQENNVPTTIAKKIIPKHNTFAFFKVSEISFHEVEEVIGDKQRIAIGGWWYGN